MLYISNILEYYYMINQDTLYGKVNAFIEHLQYNKEPDGLYSPIRYILSLGGKRLRPVLMLMSYNLYKDQVDDILPNAVALEIYHNFTLLHDDLMDKADMRRGNMTVHKKWDENTAILSGDAMLIMAYRLFVENSSSMTYLMDALKTFNDATLGVCDGQQYDVDFENRMDVSEDEYMEMIRLKTSLLLACALKIGAQLAGADEADAENLYLFGEKMGLAFQLQDDLLDVYGDPAVFGKKTGGDILCNKKTFMLINAYNMADEAGKEELMAWIKKTEFDPADKIKAVMAIYDTVGIRDICQKKIEQLFGESLKYLGKVKVNEDKKVCLLDFADRLLKRDK